jgi:hypothetical protein
MDAFDQIPIPKPKKPVPPPRKKAKTEAAGRAPAMPPPSSSSSQPQPLPPPHHGHESHEGRPAVDGIGGDGDGDHRNDDTDDIVEALLADSVPESDIEELMELLMENELQMGQYAEQPSASTESAAASAQRIPRDEDLPGPDDDEIYEIDGDGLRPSDPCDEGTPSDGAATTSFAAPATTTTTTTTTSTTTTTTPASSTPHSPHKKDSREKQDQSDQADHTRSPNQDEYARSVGLIPRANWRYATPKGVIVGNLWMLPSGSSIRATCQMHRHCSYFISTVKRRDGTFTGFSHATRVLIEWLSKATSCTKDEHQSLK